MKNGVAICFVKLQFMFLGSVDVQLSLEMKCAN